MPKFMRLISGLVICLGLFAANAAHAVENGVKELPPADVYLWVQQGFPAGLAQKIADDVGTRLKVKIAIIPGFQLQKQFYNPKRKQFSSTKIYESAKGEILGKIANPKATVIVMFKEDLYTDWFDWQYCFDSYQLPGRVSVMSMARMDETFYGEPADKELLYQRTRKFITRYIGLQYFKLPTNENKKSVLYETIMGLDDIDMIGEAF